MAKGIVGIEELRAVWEERDKDLQRMVYVEEGHIVINVHYEYNIELTRCDTHEKIVAWTQHLTEKTWMTKEVLERFIRLAMQENGLEAQMP